VTSTHDLDARVAAAAATQHGLLTRSQALALGLDRRAVARRLRAGVLEEPFAGVLRLPGPSTAPQAILAAVLAGGPGVVASHRAAAALHRLEGCDDGVLEVSSVGRQVRLPGVVAHRVAVLPRADRHVVLGVRSTGLARTLADLGSVAPETTVRRPFDDARRRGASVVWLRRTATRLHRPGQHGTRVLLDLLEEATRPASESWFEYLVERCLRSPRLPPIERQWTVRDARGRFVARLDLAMPSIRLGVEAHSRRFHFGPAAEAADERRDLQLAAIGWEVLYVGWHDLGDADRLLGVVEAAAVARGWSPAR
jgi:very-short-patch-repair endonuclease